MQKAIDIPVQFVSRQRSVDAYRELLERGVYRVAVNKVAWMYPDQTRSLIEQYGPSRVIFGVRAHKGMVDMGDDHEPVADDDFLRHVASLGGKRVIYTELDWEGNLTGEDIPTINRVAAVAPLRFTMAGGIASPEHLWMLESSVPRNVDSVVIGRAMYENRFPCQGIWRAVEAKLEPEIHAKACDNDQQSSLTPRTPPTT
jgi:phosphoribosylformimino-5-aminoimidazole carboxamide ribotide isomerase